MPAQLAAACCVCGVAARVRALGGGGKRAHTCGAHTCAESEGKLSVFCGCWLLCGATVMRLRAGMHARG